MKIIIAKADLKLLSNNILSIEILFRILGDTSDIGTRKKKKVVGQHDRI